MAALPVLLYSRHCAHSRSLLESISTAGGNLDGVLRITCVDAMLHQLPQHIDRIPALLMPNERGGNHVAFGSELHARLSDLLRGEPPATVEAFTTDSDYVFGGLIGDDPGDEYLGLYAAPDQEIRISFEQDEGDTRKGRGAGSEDVVNRLVSERAADLSRVYESMGGPAHGGGGLPPQRT